MARVANFSAGEIARRKSPGGAVGRSPDIPSGVPT